MEICALYYTVYDNVLNTGDNLLILWSVFVLVFFLRLLFWSVT